MLVLEDPSPKRLRKLLRRHAGRILAVAIVIEVESPRQVAAFSRFYNARPLSLPPELLLQG